MSIATPVYNQLLSLLSEYSPYRDLRHLKALAWMINALICSGTINLSEYKLMLRLAHRLLSNYPDIMLLERRFSNQKLFVG